jgi:hypothetical protein
VGFALLRVPEERHAAYGERVAALVPSVPDLPWLSLGATLARSLGGVERVKKFGSSPDGAYMAGLEYVNDDPEFVAKYELAVVPKGPTFRASARLVFLGGERVMDFYLANWKKIKAPDYQAARLKSILWPCSRMKSDRALRLLLEMATASKIKAFAQAWFEDNPEKTRGFLEKAASGSDKEAATAAKIIKAQDKRLKGKR